MPTLGVEDEREDSLNVKIKCVETLQTLHQLCQDKFIQIISQPNFKLEADGDSKKEMIQIQRLIYAGQVQLQRKFITMAREHDAQQEKNR